MRDSSTRVGLVAAALLVGQVLVFSPVDIWARNAGRSGFVTVAGHDVALVASLAFLLAFVPLAVIVVLISPRWRPVFASGLAAVAVLAWLYASLLFRESLAIDGRDAMLSLASPLGAAELPLLGLAVGVLAWVSRRAALPSFVLLLVLFVGNAGLAATSLVTVRPSEPELVEGPAGPLWRFGRTGNVLAILLDGLQSDIAAGVLKEDPALAADFDGFTLFKNATGVAATTFAAMPAIHSGRVWEPDRSLVVEYAESIRKGSFLTGLARAGFETTLIDPVRDVCPEGATLCTDTAIAVGPADGCPESMTLCRLASKLGGRPAVRHMQQIVLIFDMGLMRVAPYALKSHVYNAGGWMLSRGMITAFSAQHLARSREFLEVFAAKLVADDGPSAAKLFHITSTHPPYSFDTDCRHRPPPIAGGAENAARCSLRSVGAILRRLESAGIYDATTLVVFADHGAGQPSRYRTDPEPLWGPWPVMAGLANPLLMFKPPRARGAMTESMAAASIADIAATVCGLTKSCTALGGRSLLAATPEPTARAPRRFHYYQWRSEYWALRSIPGVRSFDIVGPPWERESWRAVGKPAPYALGEIIDFRTGGNAAPYLGSGWSGSETWGTWADRGTAVLRLSPGAIGNADLSLTVRGRAFVVPQYPRREVDVLINGRLAGRWSFDGPDIVERALRLPADVTPSVETLEIAFVTETTRSPAELGFSSDKRRLGIGLVEARVRAVAR